MDQQHQQQRSHGTPLPRPTFSPLLSEASESEAELFRLLPIQSNQPGKPLPNPFLRNAIASPRGSVPLVVPWLCGFHSHRPSPILMGRDYQHAPPQRADLPRHGQPLLAHDRLLNQDRSGVHGSPSLRQGDLARTGSSLRTLLGTPRTSWEALRSATRAPSRAQDAGGGTACPSPRR